MQCPMCKDSENSESLGSFKTQQTETFDIHDYTLRYCKNCNSVSVDPLPDEAIIKSSFEKKDHSNTDKSIEDIYKVIGYYQNEFNTMKPSVSLDLTKAVSVLEVGAGYGYFARACKRMNENSFTMCQDVTNIVPDLSNQIDEFFLGDLESEYLKYKSPFHIIAMTHVLQFVTQPLETLRYLSDMLCPKGIFFLTGPALPDFNKKGFQWTEFNFLNIPTLMHYFSEDSFRHVCTDLNFKLLKFKVGKTGSYLAILEKQ